MGFKAVEFTGRVKSLDFISGRVDIANKEKTTSSCGQADSPSYARSCRIARISHSSLMARS